MEKKQCSIDWLIDQIKNVENQKNLTGAQWMDVVEQAKAMHKEEMDKVAEDFWNEGASYMYDGKRKYNSFDEYYKETFGGNNE